MILGILAVLAILAIAVYSSTQGLFSSLIMTLLTLLCAVFAFSLYRPLAETMYPKSAPYAMAICLMALFGGPLLALRVGLDIILRPNVTFDEWVDRIGGGVLGFVAGLMIVGVAMVTLQLLPFGPSVLSYKPFDNTLQRQQHLGLFRPDDFVLGLVSSLSHRALGAGNDFSVNHDNFALDTFCYRNRAGHKFSMMSPAKSVKIVGAWQLPDNDDEDSKAWQDAMAELANPLMTAKENKASRVVIVRVAVSPKVTAESKEWKLPGTHFRLIDADGRSFYPLAYLTYPSGRDLRRFHVDSAITWRIWAPENVTDAERNVRLSIADLIVLRGTKVASRREDGWLVVDWVYRLPAVETNEADQDAQDQPSPDDDPTVVETAADDSDEEIADGAATEDGSAVDASDEDDSDASVAADDAPAQESKIVNSPRMWLVFRRGVELKMPPIRLGRPPKENALSHMKRAHKKAE